ncbi:MAG: D-tyrosyl-tRNA(Tyr) deacylase [Anaerolineaceae bacterium]|nr:D-tyrosyl-tRNA(Tyr) deacylase [Anaerolineaceae bacterium]
MRSVIQRVLKGQVIIHEDTKAAIKQGLVILLGIEKGDTQEKADYLAKKITNMRIFGDKEGKMNLSLLDIGGKAIVVSQFTLMANTHKGNRPSFIHAAPPDIASPLVDYFIQRMKAYGVETQSGEFGAHMLVEIHNDGPVTILLDI